MKLNLTPPPATQSDLEEARRVLGVPIPRSYETFLFRNNGALPESNQMEGDDVPQAHVAVEQFFGIGLTAVETIEAVSDAYGGRLPSGMLPIADSAGGNLIVIGLDPDARVYLWDHEMEGDPDAVQLVASTFEEFFSRLLPAPPDADEDQPTKGTLLWASPELAKYQREAHTRDRPN